MPDAWDTTLAATIHPGAPELDLVRERWTAGDPVAIAAPTILELSYGLRKGADRGNPALVGQLRWLQALPALGMVTLLPFDERAAQLAGEVRARRPFPPPGKRRAERSKAEARVAWTIDVQIAATAWAHGHDVVTENARDFQAVGAAISELAPDAPPLVVLPPPDVG